MADDESPGWNAIDRALAPLYGDQEPLHSGTIIKYMLGGPDPIDGISIYRSEAGWPHWHFVTYGYSELYAKESTNAEVSGYGLEMTFRLTRLPEESQPPGWPISFLQNLARYVFKTGNVFDVGHNLNLNGPIAVGVETAIHAAVFALDPQLPPIQTPNGRVQFLQVVGITLDELTASSLWKPRALLDILARSNPLLITDLNRPSLLADPEVAREFDEGSRREGSNTPGTFVTDPQWTEEVQGTEKHLRLTVGANSMKSLARMLLARLPHARDFSLWGKQRAVCFRSAETPNWQVEGNRLCIDLPTTLVDKIQTTLFPRRDSYCWDEFPGFTLEVVPTEIKDANGKVIDVIG